jgi:hypothetical protein
LLHRAARNGNLRPAPVIGGSAVQTPGGVDPVRPRTESEQVNDTWHAVNATPPTFGRNEPLAVLSPTDYRWWITPFHSVAVCEVKIRRIFKTSVKT